MRKASTYHIGSRLPEATMLDVNDVIERKNITSSEFVRIAIKEYLEGRQQRQSLLALEQRLTKKIFEISAAVINLSPTQLEQTKSILKSKGVTF
jgi:Arc/MetJ-type ribon-helix-helix transcriptional regulator